MRPSQLLLITFWSFSSLCLGSVYSNDPYESLLKEINLYTDTHIVPLMRTQRQRLDTYLSDTDLKMVAYLQTEYFKINKELKQLFDQNKGQGSKIMLQWESLRNRQTDIWQKALEISFKYDQVLENLLEKEIYEDKRLWRMEMNLIIDKYNALLDTNKRVFFKKHDFGEFMTPVGFLLWKFEESDSQEAGAEDGPQVFPNPTVLNNHIKLNLEQEENVIISLLDRQGKLIRILLNQKLAPGNHLLEVSLDDLPSNMYFYKISKASGSEVKKFMKE